MPSSGAAFYDERDVFEVYASGVAPGPWSANHLMEEPAFLRLLGEVSGLRVLDLGCGDARIGRRLLADGCRRYTGIDSSKKMIDAATETLRGTAGWIRLGTLEDLDEDGGAYDVVISRMAFHYVENLDRLLGACARCLVPGGRLVFSVMHPVVTSHDGRAGTGERRTELGGRRLLRAIQIGHARAHFDGTGGWGTKEEVSRL